MAVDAIDDTHATRVSIHSGQMKGIISLKGLKHERTFLHQQLHDFRMTTFGSEMQRRATIVILIVDVIFVVTRG